MRNRRLLFWLVLGLTAVILLLFFFRRDTNAEFGPPVALCPGPDSYGYRCESDTVFSYIDAKADIFLYADDATDTVPLPFPFTFYGTTYTTLTISTNGNVQLGSANATFNNQCLDDGVLTNMGDLIAPFWDDLNLIIAGTIDIDTVGEAPNRIFVVEWDDVPYFGDDLTQKVTFELQLFEATNDIVFLYEDVSAINGRNGDSATIGIQSGNQGVALQYSCNTPAVADASQLTIRHPENANRALGQQVVLAPQVEPVSLAQKGWLNELTTQLNSRGQSVLFDWQARWLNAQNQQTSSWEWADLSGNGRSDLILLRNTPSRSTISSSLVVFEADADNQFTPVLFEQFGTRETAVTHTDLLQIVDLTHDGFNDALIKLQETNQLLLLTQLDETWQLITIPEICSGSWVVVDVGNNGRLDLVRDGCATPERLTPHMGGNPIQPNR